MNKDSQLGKSSCLFLPFAIFSAQQQIFMQWLAGINEGVIYIRMEVCQGNNIFLDGRAYVTADTDTMMSLRSSDSDSPGIPYVAIVSDLRILSGLSRCMEKGTGRIPDQCLVSIYLLYRAYSQRKRSIANTCEGFFPT